MHNILASCVMLVWLVCGITHPLASQTPFATDPIPSPRYHWLSDEGEDSCAVTVKVFVLKRKLEIGHGLPTWKTIDPNSPYAVLEGRVGDRRTADRTSVGTSVSFEDFPTYHYTHDYTLNVWPDPTPDNRFINLLPLDTNANGEPYPAHTYLHCEWETGLGARNPGNPATERNRRGQSAGFFSSGHTRGEILWAWPTIGDWVHLEGAWVFDRGHPPAYTEIHPIHFCATRRHLPEPFPPLPSQTSTRIDIYANGDGGAHWNNRPGVPDFVNRVPMSRKDYTFCVNAPTRPDDRAQLSTYLIARSGNTFEAPLRVETYPDGVPGISTVPCACITVPWHTAHQPDTTVLAYTLHLAWITDTSNSLIPQLCTQVVTPYVVQVRKMRLRKIPERWPNRAEINLFLEVGGQWVYVNEIFYGSPGRNGYFKDPLSNTRRRVWSLNQEFRVWLAERDSFRIHLGGWEADGIDLKFGHLDFNPYSFCCCDSLGAAMNRAIFRPRPVGWHGCQDDRMGYLDHFVHSENLRLGQWQRVRSHCGPSEDTCPLSRRNLDESLELEFRILLLGSATSQLPDR
jgi:hypothetical protein